MRYLWHILHSTMPSDPLSLSSMSPALSPEVASELSSIPSLHELVISISGHARAPVLDELRAWSAIGLKFRSFGSERKVAGVWHVGCNNEAKTTIHGHSEK